jgi:trehalose/maltose hydrolase-like predicted phosphorylase
MQEILGIEGANQHQVIKQADVIMLLCLFRDQFDQKNLANELGYLHASYRP